LAVLRKGSLSPISHSPISHRGQASPVFRQNSEPYLQYEARVGFLADWEIGEQGEEVRPVWDLAGEHRQNVIMK